MSKPRRVPHLIGDSVKIFREAVRADETWLQYERRFVHFLQWLNLENDADLFLAKAKSDPAWAEAKVIGYIVLQKDRARFQRRL